MHPPLAPEHVVISPGADDGRWWDIAVLTQPEVAWRTAGSSGMFWTLLAVFAAIAFPGLLSAELSIDTVDAGAVTALGVVGGLLVWLSWVDVRLRVLPNVLIGGLALVVMAGHLFAALPPTGWLNAVLGMLVGGLGFGALALAVSWWTARSALGMGDVKLLTVLGMCCGASGLPLILLLASWSALPVVAWRVISGKRREAIPFGPFLCLAGWAVLLWQPDMWTLLARWQG